MNNAKFSPIWERTNNIQFSRKRRHDRFSHYAIGAVIVVMKLIEIYWVLHKIWIPKTYYLFTNSYYKIMSNILIIPFEDVIIRYRFLPVSFHLLLCRSLDNNSINTITKFQWTFLLSGIYKMSLVRSSLKNRIALFILNKYLNLFNYKKKYVSIGKQKLRRWI